MSATRVFYDLDGDGSKEVIVADKQLARVFDAFGNPWPGWPRRTGAEAQQRAAVADVDGDGSPEIAFTTVLAPLRTPTLWLFDTHGNLKPGWPVGLPRERSLAVQRGSDPSLPRGTCHIALIGRAWNAASSPYPPTRAKRRDPRL